MNPGFITTNKKFAAFFWTQFMGAFNDNFFKNSLIVLVTFRGVQLLGLAPESLVAVAGGLFILPFFLFSPLAGQLSDKFEKSQIVRWTKVSEIAIMTVAAVGFLAGSWMLLLFVLFLMGTQSTFFGPVKYSMIPELVSNEDLTEGNAFIELGTFLSILLGTIAGGFVTTLPSSVNWIAAGVLVFAIIGYLFSRKIPETEVMAGDLKIQWNPFPEFVNLFQILRERKVIWNSALGISWFWFFGAGILSVLPIYVKDYLMADEQVVTLFLAMFTLGIGMGSILCEKMSFKQVELGVVPIGSLGLTVFLLDLFLIVPPWLGTPVTFSEFFSSFQGWRLAVDFFFMSVFGGIFIVPLYTLVQERSHPETRSRVIAANNILNAIFMVGASVVVLLFYRFNLNPAEIFAVFAGFNVLVAVYIYSLVPEFTLRFYSWVLSHVMYRVKTVGRENIPKTGACILAANHVTFVDWLLLSGACKRPARFVMYYKFFEIPLIRYLMKQARVIPISGAKENPNILKRAFETMGQELTNGQVVIIFPEGQLTSDGQLNLFRPGVVKALGKNPCPVVPVVIHGMWNSLFSRSKNKDRAHRRKVTIEFLKPISPEHFQLENLESLVAEKLGEVAPHKKKVSQ